MNLFKTNTTKNFHKYISVNNVCGSGTKPRKPKINKKDMKTTQLKK